MANCNPLSHDQVITNTILPIVYCYTIKQYYNDVPVKDIDGLTCDKISLINYLKIIPNIYI